MALTKAQISELQGHFDGRSKLQSLVTAMKCYTKDASFFFAYKDGWGNKKYINIPIEPEDIMPIIEKQIESIDNDIIELTTSPEDIEVIIMNGEQLESSIADYKSRYPDTYTSLAKIRETLRQSFMCRLEDGQVNEASDYHIEVCSDWQDKIYVIEFLNQTDEYLQFEFKGIFKL